MIKKPVEMILQYYPANLNSDLDNLLVHFKYLNDALQDLKILNNDNVRYVKKLSIEYAGDGSKKVFCTCKDLG